eukprot:6210248-Pleurochrysis_carterae.AAC.2
MKCQRLGAAVLCPCALSLPTIEARSPAKSEPIPFRFEVCTARPRNPYFTPLLSGACSPYADPPASVLFFVDALPVAVLQRRHRHQDQHCDAVHRERKVQVPDETHARAGHRRCIDECRLFNDWCHPRSGKSIRAPPRLARRRSPATADATRHTPYAALSSNTLSHIPVQPQRTHIDGQSKFPCAKMAMSTATLALRLSFGAFMLASAAAMKFVVHMPGPTAAAVSMQALPLGVTIATSRAHVQMAGFGKAAPSQVTTKKNKAGKKAPPLSAKRQWDRYSALLKDGCSPCDVYARDGSDDNDEWALVGSIAFDKAGSAQASAMCQKRLILEHAARMFPRLKLQKASLV